MAEHKLKIEVIHLAELMSGNKKSELRNNDRKFQVNDILVFEHYGVVVRFKITHISNFSAALKEGYVCLSVKFVHKDDYYDAK